MNSLLIAGNIIKRAFKNKVEIIMLLILPVAAICIMTFFTGSESTLTVNAGLLNLDKGAYGERLTQYIESRGDINVVNIGENEYREAVRQGKANIAVVIPETFTLDIEMGSEAEVEFYSSGTNASYEKLKQEINQYILGIYMIDTAASDISKKTGDKKAQVTETLFKNTAGGALKLSLSLAGSSAGEEEKSRLVQSTGFALMFIMVFIFVTIGTMMKDRKKLTIARIFTYQVKEWEIAAGNLLGSLALGIIQLVPVAIAISLIFKLQAAAEIAGMFLILLCFLASTIGLGIGIAGIIKDNLNPTILTAIVIFPTCLLGGCLIPESMLPSFMGKLGYAVPQKWVMSAMQKLVTGASLHDILLDLGIILMFGLALATFGVKTLKPLSE